MLVAFGLLCMVASLVCFVAGLVKSGHGLTIHGYVLLASGSTMVWHFGHNTTEGYVAIFALFMLGIAVTYRVYEHVIKKVGR